MRSSRIPRAALLLLTACLLARPASALAIPPAPTTVTATDGTRCDYVQVNWSAVTGATIYKVYRSTSSGGTKTFRAAYYPTSSPPREHHDGVPSDGTTYHFWVEACNNDGCSGTDNGAWGHDTGYRESEPPAPTGVQATDGTQANRVVVT